ncbi:MAG: hypothetical protein KC613_12160 [Myxococcales bacterium]|nr:hypothetical protein [Myxococcales bacterium]
MRHTAHCALLLAAVTALTVACKPPEEALTRAEAETSMAEAASASAVSALTADSIEISTDFTLGEGVERAAETLADFYRSQVPCAQVAVARGEVTVDFGATGDCAWRGRTWTGQRKIAITRAEPGQVEVTHTWTDFSDGRVTVSGQAEVTWGDGARRVVHALRWTGPNGKAGTGEGDRTQTLLDPAAGLEGGLRVEGSRTWTVEDRAWGLSLVGVELRPQDPVPQAGRYILSTPFDKRLYLEFERVDAQRIRVTLTGPKREFTFTVRSTGEVDG